MLTEVFVATASSLRKRPFQSRAPHDQRRRMYTVEGIQVHALAGCLSAGHLCVPHQPFPRELCPTRSDFYPAGLSRERGNEL